MLIDTHCHINMMIKDQFDVLITSEEYKKAAEIISIATVNNVKKIINVGTSIIESENCIQLAQRFSQAFAVIGIHPNDSTDNWREDIVTLKKMLQTTPPHLIVGIGECGIDKHYQDYNLQRQKDVFRAQIELALEHNLALVIHTRDAHEETLECLYEYRNQGLRGTFHCFFGNQAFAQEAINLGFVLGIGGTITYPKNNELRSIVQTVGIEHIILETDAPYLPIQALRGKQNHPRYIKDIAEYIATLRDTSFETIAWQTTHTVEKIFNLSRRESL